MTYLKTLSLLITFLLVPGVALAQDEDDAAVDDKYAAYLTDEPMELEEEPVDVFEALILLNTQTTNQYDARALGFLIEHRFGHFKGGTSDLFGMFAPANIRIALYYGIFDWWQVGLGSAKNGFHNDLSTKFRLLRQKDGGMPLALSYFGQVTLQGGPSENFDKFGHRVAYFQQLLIARKFGHWLSLQIAPSFMHFNVVDKPAGYRNDNFGIIGLGRVTTSATTAVVVEGGMGQILYSPDDEELDSRPILSLGFEYVTSGHAFQVFVSTANQITNHQMYVYNPNDVLEAEVFLGFNITRNWNF